MSDIADAAKPPISGQPTTSHNFAQSLTVESRTPRTLVAPFATYRAFYWGSLVVLFLAEQIALLPLGASRSFWQTHSWTWWALAPEKSVPSTFVFAIAGAVLLSWENLTGALRNLVDAPGGIDLKWLFIHLGVLGSLLGWIALCRGDSMYPSPYWDIWIWLRLVLELLTLATWALAMLPPALWFRWITSSPNAFIGGLGFALIAKLLGHYTEILWWFFQRSTLLTVAALLQLCGQVPIIGPAANQVGTPAFTVEIGYACAGLEGLGVMMAFLGFYFWAYRRDLRFPQVLLLLPIGLGLEWLSNSARIAVLILLGAHNQAAAEKAFHSVGGWLLVSAIAFALVTASWRVPAFTRDHAEARALPPANPAGVYLVPLLVIIATAMITAIFNRGFDVLYPVRVLAAAAALYFYRRELAAMSWSVSIWAVLIGVFVFVTWLALATPNASLNESFATGIAALSQPSKTAWFFSRIVGATITVPIAEELAFRGYLMRKFIADDFAKVPFGAFTWLSFLGSSVLFGVLHGEWMAGILAGAAFAVAVYRRGLLVDAIIAHSVANVLLSAYVLTTQQWSLWS